MAKAMILAAGQGTRVRPLTVALDVTITPELEAEGMARDLVNRIQNIRKEKDFEVTDRIKVKVEKHIALDNALELFGDYINNETLANELTLVGEVPGGQEVELPGEVKVMISVEKV